MNIEGTYFDPNHGGCVRTISRTTKKHIYLVRGAYGKNEAHPPNTEWTATMGIGEEGRFLTVDFVGKQVRHLRVYRALWCPKVGEIHWEDGNVWKRVHAVASSSKKKSP